MKSSLPDSGTMEYLGSINSQDDFDDDLSDPVQKDKPKCTKIVPDMIHHQDWIYGV